MTTTVSWLLLLIVQLNRDFHRAGIYLPDDDYAGVRDLLAIIPIEDGHVRTRRPRQMSKLFSAEQIVHRERERQQRNKVTSGLAVVQHGGDYLIVDL